MSKKYSVTIELDFPVDLADRTLTELVMRCPTVEDELKYAPTAPVLKKQLEEEARYWAALCGLPLEEFKLVHIRDYKKVTNQYNLFRDGKTKPQRPDADGGDPLASGQDVA